ARSSRRRGSRSRSIRNRCWERSASTAAESPLRPLPIDAALADIIAALRTRPRLLLRAAPGAGKTTRVPAALLDAGLAGARRLIVLEPRRIAARAAAEWVARPPRPAAPPP